MYDLYKDEENFIIYFLFHKMTSFEKEEFKKLIREEKYDEILNSYYLEVNINMEVLKSYKKEYNLLISIFKNLNENEVLIDDFYNTMYIISVENSTQVKANFLKKFYEK
jgi:hypothetical protein